MISDNELNTTIKFQVGKDKIDKATNDLFENKIDDQGFFKMMMDAYKDLDEESRLYLWNYISGFMSESIRMIRELPRA